MPQSLAASLLRSRRRFRPVPAPIAQPLQRLLRCRLNPTAPPGFSSQAGPKEGSGPKDSLLLKAAQMKRDTPAESAAATMVKEEEEILKNITEKKALMSAKELAKGVSYTVRMETGCVAPALARDERNTKRRREAAAGTGVGISHGDVGE